MRKTTVHRHIRKTKKGRIQVKKHIRQVRKKHYVNPEAKKYLREYIEKQEGGFDAKAEAEKRWKELDLPSEELAMETSITPISEEITVKPVSEAPPVKSNNFRFNEEFDLISKKLTSDNKKFKTVKELINDLENEVKGRIILDMKKAGKSNAEITKETGISYPEINKISKLFKDKGVPIKKPRKNAPELIEIKKASPEDIERFNKMIGTSSLKEVIKKGKIGDGVVVLDEETKIPKKFSFPMSGGTKISATAEEKEEEEGRDEY